MITFRDILEVYM